MDSAMYVLVGTLMGAAISSVTLLIREWLANRNSLKRELVRLYGKDRLEAYKRLLTFVWRIADKCYPLADDKLSNFTRIMQTDFEKYVKPAYLYYDEETIKMLDKFDAMYFSCTQGRPDLTEQEERDLERFMEHDICDLALRLRDLARKEAALAKMI